MTRAAQAQTIATALPYRGGTDSARPARLAGLALPPARMPSLRGGRPLKSWHYVVFLSPELICCAAQVRIGPARDSFWAVLDRRAGLFWHGRRGVAVATGSVALAARRIAVQIEYGSAAGIETVCGTGAHYGWTAKRAPLPATAALGGERIEGHVLSDETAAYYPRHTRWFWSAGVGRSPSGQTLAWNLVDGVNDPPRGSERTVWVDGVAHEPPPSVFAADLSAVDGLRFTPEATLRRHTDVGLIRSDYRQPIGSFSGTLSGGIEVRDGLGVMERHDAWW